MAGPYFFAWCDEATPFDEAMQVEDEAIFELEIAHIEGDFAALTIEVANPFIGLLGPGRKQWCWVSWFDGSDVIAQIHARLVGVPERLTDEVVRLLFIARPSDFPTRKENLAASLRVLPWWDPLWLVQSIKDPDTVLETRSSLWHIDRLTLDLTISDRLVGEDGLIEVSEAEHFYDGVEVALGATPLRNVVVTATVTWSQTATGDVDLTAALVAAFQAAGSPFCFPLVSSYTSEGLLSSWPKPGDSLSGGWAMSADSFAVEATDVEAIDFAVRYTDKSDSTSVFGFTILDALGNSAPGSIAKQFFVNWKNFDVVFADSAIRTHFSLTYIADRKRSEIITFALGASLQSILTDPQGAELETLTLNSALVDQPVDDGGALPIGDTRRNAFFPTERGQLSLQFLLLLARDKLRARARAVTIKIEGTWQKFAAAASLRKNMLLSDRRLPGGQATGKIISYRLIASGTGANFCEVSIGCAIGYGIVLPMADPGRDTYANGYSTSTARSGGTVGVIPGELHYDDLAGSYVIDDDGLNLFDMRPETVISALTVTDGLVAQDNAIRFALAHPGEQPAFQKTIVADIDGTAISNIKDPAGLVSGTQYLALLAGMPNPSTSNDLATRTATVSPTFFTFDGATGGTLSRPLASTPIMEAFASFGGRNSKKARSIMISTKGPGQRGLTPDPIGALGKHPTVVDLKLVPVTGGEFQTLYTVNTFDLVIPKTIDLEAA